jgi:hypothetical protein
MPHLKIKKAKDRTRFSTVDRPATNRVNHGAVSRINRPNYACKLFTIFENVLKICADRQQKRFFFVVGVKLRFCLGAASDGTNWLLPGEGMNIERQGKGYLQGKEYRSGNALMCVPTVWAENL